MKLEIAVILALFLESISYGIFTTLFCILLVMLFNSPFPKDYYYRIIIPSACLMMVIATAHIVIDIIRFIMAFVFERDADMYYHRIGTPLHDAKNSLFFVQTMLGDTVMLWRCYAVYNQSYYVLLFGCVPLGLNFVMGVLGIRGMSTSSGQNRVARIYASRWVATYFALTMSINIVSTVAIVYRIYQTTWRYQPHKKVLPLMGTIIESGALYAASVLGLLVSYLTDSNGLYPAVDIVPSLVGIYFSLIVLRIHFHLSRSHPKAQASSTLPTLATMPHWRNMFADTSREVNSISERRRASFDGIDSASISTIDHPKDNDHHSQPV